MTCRDGTCDHVKNALTPSQNPLARGHALRELTEMGWDLHADIVEGGDSQDSYVELGIHEANNQTARVSITVTEDSIDVVIRDGRDGSVKVRATIDLAGGVDCGTFL